MNVILNGTAATEGVRMLPVQTPASAPKVKPLETSREKLVRGAMDGFAAVYTAFGLPQPQLVEIITPFEQR
jgi:hypothetical protein